MLYIFRYFKEIQKGIFVIKTMFEMFCFCLIDLCRAKSVWGTFMFFLFCFVFVSFALPIWCHYKMVSRPATPKQTCRLALVFSLQCRFRFAHDSVWLCVHVCVWTSFYLMKQTY